MMRGRLIGGLATVGVTALLLTEAVSAQAPRPEDVASVDAIIGAYYDVISGPAGEAADVARDRSLHHPDASG